MLLSGQANPPSKGRGRGRVVMDSSSSPPGTLRSDVVQRSSAGRVESSAPSPTAADQPSSSRQESQRSPRTAGRGRARPRKPEQQLYVPRGRREQGQVSETSASKRSRPDVQLYVPRGRRKQEESLPENVNRDTEQGSESWKHDEFTYGSSGDIDVAQLKSVKESSCSFSGEQKSSSFSHVSDLTEGESKQCAESCAELGVNTKWVHSSQTPTPSRELPKDATQLACKHSLPITDKEIHQLENDWLKSNTSYSCDSLSSERFSTVGLLNCGDSVANEACTEVRILNSGDSVLREVSPTMETTPVGSVTDIVCSTTETSKSNSDDFIADKLSLTIETTNSGDSVSGEMGPLAELETINSGDYATNEMDPVMETSTSGDSVSGEIGPIEQSSDPDDSVSGEIGPIEQSSEPGDSVSGEMGPIEQSSDPGDSVSEEMGPREQSSDPGDSVSEEMGPREQSSDPGVSASGQLDHIEFLNGSHQQSQVSLPKGEKEESELNDVVLPSVSQCSTVLDNPQKDIIDDNASDCSQYPASREISSNIQNDVGVDSCELGNDGSSEMFSEALDSAIALPQTESTLSGKQNDDAGIDKFLPDKPLVREASMEHCAVSDVKSNAENSEEDDEDSWDKLYDDNGDCLDPTMMEELTAHVGSVEISKPKKTINYLDFQPQDPDMDMSAYGHVIEISDFPVEFQSRDLFTAFKDYMSRGFDLKWVDDTHALGVFASAVAAQDALKMIHPMMKLKPLSEASKQSRSKARRCQEFLQPYKARPVTSAAAARRLVTGALGMTPRLSKEQRDKERQVLKEARDKKRQDRKQKIDMWDGNIGKCVMDDY